MFFLLVSFSKFLFEIFINDELILVKSNTSVLEACESLGIQIPRFCYHERLSIAGNCRMCLIEIEKAPKPIAACAVPVEPNMTIFTSTPLVEKARENVLEFLLLNHPLDCPICDQGGECDLQEQALAFGSDRTRFFFPKRSVEDKNCGLLVKTIMTRCIHCTRCVRFFQDVLQQGILGTTSRGRETEIASYAKGELVSEFVGNIIDLCPVGALTSKPYMFSARPWELRSSGTVDLSDSIGSNIRIDFKETQIVRILPLLDDSLNEEWISDKTRFSFDGFRLNRLTHPFVKIDNGFLKTDWRKVFEIKEVIFSDLLHFQTEQILLISGNNTDLKTLTLLKLFSLNFSIDLLCESAFNISSDLMMLCKSNVVFSTLFQSDLCLTLGTNVRFEAALFNLSLKKRARSGGFNKASFGSYDSGFSINKSLGNSTSSNNKFIEGQSFFCKKFSKARRPFLVVGTSFLKRIDSDSLQCLVKTLSNVSSLVLNTWLGFNFLSLTSNCFSELLLSLKTANRHQINHKRVIYLLGPDSTKGLSSKLWYKNSFIISQQPFLQGSSFTTLLLPASLFVEKQSEYINLEGRLQITTRALVAPDLAKDDAKILSFFFSPLLFSKFSSFSHSEYAFDIKDNYSTFTRNLLLTLEFGIKKRFHLAEKTTLVNFFSSNVFTSNSPLMLKSATHFTKLAQTFLLL